MPDPYHYPPELVELLIETIPRLLKGKRAVLDLLISAGADPSQLSDLRHRVTTNSGEITKFEIVRTALIRLNEAGDSALRTRRELLKRVTEWEDFSTCWDSDMLKAKGLIAEVRRVVGVKDAFTRMAQERERDTSERRQEYEKKVAAMQKRDELLKALRARLAACFAANDPQGRGKELERILNEFFALAGVGVREAFHVVGDRGEGIVEQIDGAIELDGRFYIVEMKWWSKPLGMPEVAAFMMKLFTRGGCGGIVIAHPGLTAAAVTTLREGLAQGAVVFGCSLEAMFRVLDGGQDLRQFLKGRVEASTLDRKPYLDGAAASQ